MIGGYTELFTGFLAGPAVAKKRTIAKCTFFSVLVAPVIVSAEYLSLVVLLLCVLWLAASSWRISVAMAYLIIPLLLMLVIGAQGIISHPIYDVAKDAWYVGKPIPVLVLGYILMRYINEIRSLLLIIVLAAVFSSIVHLVTFFSHPAIYLESVRVIREEIGRGYLITVLGITALFACWHFHIRLFSNIRGLHILIMAILFTSLALSYSRTLWASLLIMVLTLFGLWGKITWKTVIAMLLVGIATAMFVLMMTYEAHESHDVSLLAKMVHSIREVVISDYSESRDINQYWRGFEAYRAMVTYVSGSITQYVFGHGYGALVDLGLYIKLGENEMRYIPIMHNGYTYILVKMGALGLLMYLYFFMRIIKIGNNYFASPYVEIQLAARLLAGLGWMFLFTTMVISGLFNKSEILPAIILTGALFSYLHTTMVRYKVAQER